MFPQGKPGPDSLTDEQLHRRLEAAARNPARLEKWFKRSIPLVTAAGIIGAVFIATSLGLGGIGEIALLFALAGGLLGSGALCSKQQDKWEDERRILSVEQQVRPARLKLLAQSLKENFILAMTGGTKEKLTVKPPLKLKTRKPEAQHEPV